ncbi:hypothetical protein K491DRAFT_436831 [Lophiostoma macrostomum CBS 122681]|uniref:MIT domain-containing protein n=1 Tax=Lophiostoma macrostomum CBS 122681 TaxID=1314788 RepID=A0A6A6T529_9PLEO|nr:hypothetical protein K491DRAFT_436831 [Lophiostoma macrostomum CBS 122681]
MAAAREPRSLNPICEDYDSEDTHSAAVIPVRRGSVHIHVKPSSSKAVNITEASDSGYSSQSAAARSSSDSASTYNDVQSTSTSSRFSKDSGYRSETESSKPVYVTKDRGVPFHSNLDPRGSRHDADSSLPNDYPPSATPRKPLQRSDSTRQRARRQPSTEECKDPNCASCGPLPPARTDRRRRMSYADRPMTTFTEQPYGYSPYVVPGYPVYHNPYAMGPPPMLHSNMHTNPFTPPHSRPASYETEGAHNLPMPHSQLHLSSPSLYDVMPPGGYTPNVSTASNISEVGAPESENLDNSLRIHIDSKGMMTLVQSPTTGDEAQKESKSSRPHNKERKTGSIVSQSSSSSRSTTHRKEESSKTRRKSLYQESRSRGVTDRSPHGGREEKLDDLRKEMNRSRLSEAELAAEEKTESEKRARRASLEADERDRARADARAQARAEQKARQQEEDKQRKNEKTAKSHVRDQDASGAPLTASEKGQKTMLSRALQKANAAVLLDNAQKFEGATEAYEDSCKLLQQVMIRTPSEDDRRKVDAIRVVYSNRVEELKRLAPAPPSSPLQGRDHAKKDKETTLLEISRTPEGVVELSENTFTWDLNASTSPSWMLDPKTPSPTAKKETIGPVPPASRDSKSKLSGIAQSSSRQITDASQLLDPPTSKGLEDADSKGKGATSDQGSEPLYRALSMSETSPDMSPDYIASEKLPEKRLVLLPSHKVPSSLKKQRLSSRSTETGSGTRLDDDQDEGDGSVADSSRESGEECQVSMQSALDTAMNVVKNLLLQELLDFSIPEARKALPAPVDGTDASGSSNASSRGSSNRSYASSSPTSNAHAPQRRKRMRESGRDPDDDGDDDSDGDDRPKKKNDKTPPGRIPQRRLKCPFYQREPEKYTKAACKGEGFADMAKLKDHIKRVHTQPLRCPRCRLEMKSEHALSEHLEQEDCEKSPRLQDDRITTQLLSRLNFKKAPYSNAASVEDKWKLMFKVLFPDDCAIPSPYDTYGLTPQIERALAEALEEELTRELALVLDPIMARIKKRIPAIIENCRTKVMEMALSSRGASACTPSSSSLGTSSSTSESEGGRLKKQAASPAASGCSDSSFEIVSEALTPQQSVSENVSGKRPQQPRQYTPEQPLSNEQQLYSGSNALESTEPWLGLPGGTNETTNMIDIFPDCMHGYDIGDFALFGGVSIEGISQNIDTLWPESQMENWSLPQLEVSKPELQNNPGPRVPGPKGI